MEVPKVGAIGWHREAGYFQIDWGLIGFGVFCHPVDDILLRPEPAPLAAAALMRSRQNAIFATSDSAGGATTFCAAQIYFRRRIKNSLIGEKLYVREASLAVSLIVPRRLVVLAPAGPPPFSTEPIPECEFRLLAAPYWPEEAIDMTASDERRLWTRKEVCEHLRVTEKTVDNFPPSRPAPVHPTWERLSVSAVQTLRRLIADPRRA